MASACDAIHCSGSSIGIPLADRVGRWCGLTPCTPVFLILTAVGLAHAVTLVRKNRAVAFLLSWILVVVVRLHLPGAVNFDVVRHFLELFPPLAMVAAIGTRAMVAGLPKPRAAMAATALLVTSLQLFALAQVHPYETAYWNRSTGAGRSSKGSAAAADRKIPQWGDYWGVTYRHGVEWLNANAPKNSLLIVPIAAHTVRLVAPLRLRHDITLIRYATAEFPTRDLRRLAAARGVAQKRPLLVMFITRDDWANEMTDYCTEKLRPLQTWHSGGAPLLRIYRLE